ncbi:MAG: PAC2 family protein, partial [Candidatus Bathyarchaeia archaeon]
MTVEIIAESRSLRGCTFITGFHGIGETGYIAVSYLIHALKAKRIGFIRVERPPPFVTTSNAGIITPFEIYRKNLIVLLKLEFPPHRAEETQLLKSIASWVVKAKFKDATLIVGLGSNVRQDDTDFRAVPTS